MCWRRTPSEILQVPAWRCRSTNIESAPAACLGLISGPTHAVFVQVSTAPNSCPIITRVCEHISVHTATIATLWPAFLHVGGGFWAIFPGFQAECCRFDPGHPLSINLAKVSVYDLPARPSASPTLNPVRSCAPERKGLHDEQPISASVQETPTQHLLPIQREPSCQNQDPPVSA